MIIRAVVCAAAGPVAYEAAEASGPCGAGRRGAGRRCESDALSLLQTGALVEDVGSGWHYDALSLKKLYREVWIRDYVHSFTPAETPSHLILRGPARKRGNVSGALPPWMRPRPGREEYAFELRVPKLPCYSKPNGLPTLVELHTQEWFLSQSRCLNLTNAQLLLGWEFDAGKWQYIPLASGAEEGGGGGGGGARSFAQGDKNHWYLLADGCRVVRSPAAATIMWSPSGAVAPLEGVEQGFGRVLIDEEPAAPCAGLLNGSVVEARSADEGKYVYLKDHVRKRLVAARRQLEDAGFGGTFNRRSTGLTRLMRPIGPVNAAAF